MTEVWTAAAPLRRRRTWHDEPDGEPHGGGAAVGAVVVPYGQLAVGSTAGGRRAAEVDVLRAAAQLVCWFAAPRHRM